jgi:hypothetical protein
MSQLQVPIHFCTAPEGSKIVLAPGAKARS